MGGRLDAVATVVDDMAATLAFYRICGLDIPAEADGEGYVSIDLSGGLRMAWNTVEVEREFNPDWQPPVGAGRMGVTFLCGNADEVDATHARLVAAGHESPLPPFDATWGNRHCRILDPDGNAVDLFAEK
jgi:catechol 2,3-dioxygenase-like lactoylglutathione lyase family enzyme